MGHRSELKENVLAAKVEKGLLWVLEHKIPIAVFAGVLVFGLMVASVVIIRRNEKREEHWGRMAQAQSFINQNQLAQARQILTDIKADGPDHNTSLYISYYLGQAHLAEKNYQEATQNFSDVVSMSGNFPMTPLALSNLGHSYEGLKDFSKAAETYQAFMDQFNDHFMAPRIQLAMGRSLVKSGDYENGKAALEQLIDLYPTSPWSENARRILDKIESR